MRRPAALLAMALLGLAVTLLASHESETPPPQRGGVFLSSFETP